MTTPDPIAEAAALWRMRLEAGTAERSALDAWLAADPRHRAAFADVESIWTFFDAAREEPALRRVRQDLRGRVAAGRRRARGMTAAAAGGLVAATLAAALLLGRPPEIRSYETAGHSRQTVQLSDGSTVLLDAGSKLLVRYARHRRDLTLERGQARFEVAHDASRPFVVRAGARQVIATGTIFDVDLESRGLAVALLQGRVRIVAARQAAPVAQHVVELRQGEQFVAGPGGGRVSRFDPEAVTAWETGHVVINDLPLDQALRRVNRYVDRPVALADPGLARLRVSGVFNAGDARAFAEAVAGLLPVSAECRADGGIILAPRPAEAAPKAELRTRGAGSCA
jgi:transmembrane sensor